MRILLLICVLLVPTHLFHVGFGNYKFNGMDIKSIVKRFFYETVPYSGTVIRSIVSLCRKGCR